MCCLSRATVETSEGTLRRMSASKNKKPPEAGAWAGSIRVKRIRNHLGELYLAHELAELG